MKRIARHLSLLLVLTMVIAMIPAAPSFAAARKPATPKITKVAVDQKTAKVTVTYSKAKNAKSYRLYRRTAKTSWKYFKKIKASQKKKYSNANKYKLVKNGKKFKVYKRVTTYAYKQLSTSTKTSMTFTGTWKTNYDLVIRAYNGKKAGNYSAVKTAKIGEKIVVNDTYVFFGSDSRAKDESWKSQNGGKITTDTSGTQGVPRSDVIMLINVNKTDKTVDVVSVYRDTAMNKSTTDEVNFQKANKAYADYGPKEACKVLERNLDIKIKGYAASNFKGVAKVIDDLIKLDPEHKGITVSGLAQPVESQDYIEKGQRYAYDTLNYVISDMNKVYGIETPLVPAQDTQDLKYGMQAVAYARVRSTEGSEMQRTVRQRTVLKQMIEKYVRLSPQAKLDLIINNKASIEVGFLDGGQEESYQRFANIIKDAANYNKETYSYRGYPFYKAKCEMFSAEEGGLAALYIPSDIVNNVSRLHNIVLKGSGYKPSETVKKISKALENKTGFNYEKRNTKWDNEY